MNKEKIVKLIVEFSIVLSCHIAFVYSYFFCSVKELVFWGVFIISNAIYTTCRKKED